MAPHGNRNIDVVGTPSTQVMVNANGDKFIASNQNQIDRAELDSVRVAIPGQSSSRVPMSSTDSQRPEFHDVTTAIHGRAVDNDPRIVSLDEMVPSIQESHGMYTHTGDHNSPPFNHSKRSESPNTGSYLASGDISLVSHVPKSTLVIFDPIRAHIPLKIKEKIWRCEFIHLGVLLKSATDLGSDSTLDGDFVLKGGALTVVNKKPDSLSNIETWTSAFMIYMTILLEKWPSKAQEYLKYMQSIRLASSRGTNNCWAVYDEQCRLNKERYPSNIFLGCHCSGIMGLCVVTGNVNQSSSVVMSNNFPPSLNYQSRQVSDINPSRIQARSPYNQSNFRGYSGAGFQSPQKCRRFNQNRCMFGKKCKFHHKCSKCNGAHTFSRCRN
ncbi:unnamed protein product [Mytilus coruscus]|uniref:C3H1-type domain-containing protein n=1 Tax=Mytilus coruscus TaxID=42192 RepID=A0A6J8DKY5_MYTCO|nr:unnamed protein product [Mytilus coruscus]